MQNLKLLKQKKLNHLYEVYIKHKHKFSFKGCLMTDGSLSFAQLSQIIYISSLNLSLGNDFNQVLDWTCPDGKLLCIDLDKDFLELNSAFTKHNLSTFHLWRDIQNKVNDISSIEKLIELEFILPEDKVLSLSEFSFLDKTQVLRLCSNYVALFDKQEDKHKIYSEILSDQNLPIKQLAVSIDNKAIVLYEKQAVLNWLLNLNK